MHSPPNRHYFVANGTLLCKKDFAFPRMPLGRQDAGFVVLLGFVGAARFKSAAERLDTLVSSGEQQVCVLQNPGLYRGA
ncbi:hypothetical protein BDN71DRAFT_314554 [Pleurotus eryngii]|uniref:Uncharacterized protein n=1 Tax=Pleurotus eryngii TaxID=5323 RepID=A0A9P6A3G0_PLEER|nr:hypothetical protein BDN71DRAFT_314554 [Pleurotus eryngii]